MSNKMGEIKFSDDRRWWTVREADSRYTVCTRSAEFGRGIYYTIVDSELGVRGPCNLIGQGWDRDMGDKACADLLRALQSGEVEVSHRNRVQPDIESRRGGSE